MAKKIIHQLVDDVDGSVLDVGAGETVLFSLDGVPYEIDLSAKNAEALRKAFEPYISAGRRVSAGRPAASPAARRPRSRRGATNENTSIREWAEANGYAVATRGRIPENIVAAYHAAN